MSLASQDQDQGQHCIAFNLWVTKPVPPHHPDFIQAQTFLKWSFLEAVAGKPKHCEFFLLNVISTALQPKLIKSFSEILFTGTHSRRATGKEFFVHGNNSETWTEMWNMDIS